MILNEINQLKIEMRFEDICGSSPLLAQGSTFPWAAQSTPAWQPKVIIGLKSRPNLVFSSFQTNFSPFYKWKDAHSNHMPSAFLFTFLQMGVASSGWTRGATGAP